VGSSSVLSLLWNGVFLHFSSTVGGVAVRKIPFFFFFIATEDGSGFSPLFAGVGTLLFSLSFFFQV